MTPQTIATVQKSWSSLRPIADDAMTTFYAELFESDPALRAFFPEDIQFQKKKLQSTLNMAIGWLHAPDVVVPALKELGERHTAYGVQAQHYQTAAVALLRAMSVHMGDQFDAKTKAAWEEMLGFVAQTMLSHEAVDVKQAA